MGHLNIIIEKILIINILADGAVRTGFDVLKFMALGADIA
jgi:isopentenyl diphosphate isomerase/L-lactate dehydrogenase-like FMN-dependent dehydrogenase